MSRAIANVVFGWPLPDRDENQPLRTALAKAIYEDDDELVEHHFDPNDLDEIDAVLNDFEPLVPGFYSRYSAHGPVSSVIYFGVDMGAFHEGSNVKTSDLTLQATAAVKVRYGKMLDALPEAIREAAPEPAVWIIWSSS